jgi:hypothetical protein
MKRATLSIALAFVMAAAAATPAALAASAKARSKPAPAQKAPAAVGRPAAASQDQSYLFLNGPKEGRGVPDYITAGMKHSNQPWFMTRYDRLGNWP